MNFLIAFVISFVSLLLTKKYWTGFFLGATMFLIVYMAFLDSANPYRSDSLSTTIGYSIGTYLIPFIIAGFIWGFTKKKRPDTPDKDQTNNSDQISN